MSKDHPDDLLDDPEHLRSESSRLRSIIATLSDQELKKKKLSEHSFYLAQRAETISRIPEVSAIGRISVEQPRPALRFGAIESETPTVKLLGGRPVDTIGAHDLRELAA